MTKVIKKTIQRGHFQGNSQKCPKKKIILDKESGGKNGGGKWKGRRNFRQEKDDHSESRVLGEPWLGVEETGDGESGARGGNAREGDGQRSLDGILAGEAGLEIAENQKAGEG